MTLSRPVIVAGNWKMNTNPADAGRLAADIAIATDVAGVTRVVFPPYVALAAVRDALAATPVEVGAQNVHWEPAGAYTGEVSGQMLVGLATWCIVGHSERRRDQGESDELIGRKLLRCAENALRPILCVGEQLAEREAGLAEETVRGQLERSIGELRRLGAGLPADLVIAYEPVWAIGTGRTARGSDAAAMAALIRRVLAEAAGVPDEGASVPVLYGGSVTSASIAEFLAEPDIDGALVGGASLKVDEMAGIVARAGMTAAARTSAA
ncbi:MAG: triose-phosphate isomerase [Chloroflexota bacterium]